MDILFDKISNKSFFLAYILKFFNKKMYYLFLEINSGAPKKKNNLLKKLNFLKLYPLPVEQSENIPYSIQSDLDFDPKNLIKKKSNFIYSNKISKIFLKKIPNNKKEHVKLLLKDFIGNDFTQINAYLDLWKRKNKKILFFTSNIKHLFLVKKSKNIILIYIPTDIIKFLIQTIYNITKIFIRSFSKIFYQKQKQKKNNKIKVNEQLVSLILHFETFYGEKNDILYDKTLYYSNKLNNLKPKNIIHFGYVNKKIENKNLNYKYLSDNHLKSKDFIETFFFILRSIISIRKLSDVFFIFILAINLKYFYNCRNIIKEYPKLKIALIDYDFLCPKIIIMTLMSLKIKTIATQERFISSFYKNQNILIDDYFTPSKKMNKIINKNKSIKAKNLIPVGLYRSDKIFNKTKKRNIKKIIVALGFHTSRDLQSSTVEFLINWKSSRLFLEEMYQLSKDMNNSKIIIRLKNFEGYKNSYFKEIIKKIKNRKNIEIDNSTFTEYSYKICSKADLIIARHTSIADECLSRGIPVILHDYTHNMKGIIRGAFDYTHNNTSMICVNYSDMLKKANLLLAPSKNKLKINSEALRKKYYFYDEKKTIKKKIILHLNKYLDK